MSETWADGLSALKDALTLEAHVTRKTRDIASTCEDPERDDNFNDYHVSFNFFYHSYVTFSFFFFLMCRSDLLILCLNNFIIYSAKLNDLKLTSVSGY